jgi:hypothetical protein
MDKARQNSRPRGRVRPIYSAKGSTHFFEGRRATGGVSAGAGAAAVRAGAGATGRRARAAGAAGARGAGRAFGSVRRLSTFGAAMIGALAAGAGDTTGAGLEMGATITGFGAAGAGAGGCVRAIGAIRSARA